MLQADATYDLGGPSPSCAQKQRIRSGRETSSHGNPQIEMEETPLYKPNGPMDIFATIALATRSPSLPLQNHLLPSKRASIFGYEGSRPPKRSRSEKLPSCDITKETQNSRTRPATSGEPTSDARLLEAELLVHFAQRSVDEWSIRMHESNDATYTREVSHTVHYLPPRTPLKDPALSSNGTGTANGQASIEKEHDEKPTNSVESTSASNQASPVADKQDAHDQQTKNALESLPSQPSVEDAQVGRVALQQSPEAASYSNVAAVRNSDDPQTGDQARSRDIELSALFAAQDNQGDDPISYGQSEVIHSEETENCAKTQLADDAISTGGSGYQKETTENILEYACANAEEAEIPAPELSNNELRVVHGVLNNSKNGNDSQPLAANSIPPDAENAVKESAAGLSTSHRAPTAICTACKFARNSISIDSENQSTSWISCDGCKSWFHFACAGFKGEREVRSVDKYRCRKCRPLHGATTYVRKSSRAHSAIDYAGLHQGVIKTSDDRPEHHYIRPIRDGIISFLPESFARMRPELVTADYFERGSGMKEPIVIPAALNPRPSQGNESQRQVEPQDHKTQKGDQLENNANLEEWLSHGAESQRVPDEGQDALDMVMPHGLTVRKVAELYGPEEKVEVIDVKSQNGENKKWNMKRWVDYYENPDDSKIVRNVISLEVSQSKLGKLIRRPQIVRDLDLQDSVWPEELIAKGEYPRVQFYCLMSVADCFTDFHIDFGGSSVFYHILKGKKTFLFIPPKEKHLKKYEEWCMSPAQNWTFLADQTKECYRVDLSEGDTMLIPSGWIHAVWTPEDSLVIGGNFLTRMNYGMQLRIAQVEKATGVARKFRYPHFQKIHWYTIFRYLQDDPLPASVRAHLESGHKFYRSKPTHYDFDEWSENSHPGPENYHARYYPQPELDGLPDLLRYVLRTVLIDNGSIAEGITAETRNAVRKSIPRGHGEPMGIIKTFAIWCSWKRGNEPIPHWAYPDAVAEVAAPDKLSAAASKKLADEAALKAPRRQSARMQSQKNLSAHASPEEATKLDEQGQPNDPTGSGEKRSLDQLDEASNVGVTSYSPSKKAKAASGATGSHRKTACESCRRRRRACKHKYPAEPPTPSTQKVESTTNPTAGKSLLVGDSLREKLSSIGGLFDSIKPRNEAAQAFIPPQEYTGTTNVVDHQSSQQPDTIGNVSMVQMGMSAMPHPQETGLELGSMSGNASPSRPRTKACNYCRKSKVRAGLFLVRALYTDHFCSDGAYMMLSATRIQSRSRRVPYRDLMLGSPIRVMQSFKRQSAL